MNQRYYMNQDFQTNFKDANWEFKQFYDLIKDSKLSWVEVLFYIKGITHKHMLIEVDWSPLISEWDR